MLYAVNNGAAPGASDEIAGLPDSRSAGAVIALFDHGHSLAIADRRHGLDLYALQPGAARGSREARLIARHRLEGVVALEGSGLGLVALIAREATADLCLIKGESATTITTLDGMPSALAVMGGSVVIGLAARQRQGGVLVRIDLRQRVVKEERALANAAVTLAADPGGERLALVDRAARRVNLLGADLALLDPSSDDDVDCAVPALGRGVIQGRAGRLVHRALEESAGPRVPLDLLWPVATLQRAGRFLIAQDATQRHAALLGGDDLALLTEWQFGRGGVSFATEHGSTRVLARHHGETHWSLIDLARLAQASGHALDPGTVTRVTEKTFIGGVTPALLDAPGPKTGPLETLVLPVIEGDQAFESADLDGFAAYFQRAVAPLVRDYYHENSYGLLDDVRFALFGATVGPKSGPLRLKRAHLSDYHFPPFEPARVELARNGVTAATPIVLDGREALTLEAEPLAGGPPGATLNVPFFALAFEQSHERFPVRLRFHGIEHVNLNVTTPSGVIHALDLAFPARTIEINAHDVAARLDELAIYLEGVFQSAELSAGVANRLFARPKVQRVPGGGDGFGRLITTVMSSLANGPKLVINAATAVGVGADDPLGLGRAVSGMIFAGSEAILGRYLGLALELAQEGAGFNHAARIIGAPRVRHDPPTSRLTITLPIADRFAGPGARIKVAGSTGLGALFEEAEAHANSASMRESAERLRDREALFEDAYGAACERLRAHGLPASLLARFRSVIVLPLEPASMRTENASAPQASEAWSVSAPVRPFRLRGGGATMTVLDRAASAPGLQAAWALVPFAAGVPDVAGLCRALGHALGFADLERRLGDRADLAFMESWALMGRASGLPHHAGWHKLEAGWISGGRGTPSHFGRVLPLPVNAPAETREVEVLLAPIEVWRDSLVRSARAAFGVGEAVPVVQLIKLDRGGAGHAFDLVEARQQGPRFPLAGSAAAANVGSPAVIVTSIGTPGGPQDARALHLADAKAILREPGERLDLGTLGAFALPGTVVELMERQLVEGDVHVVRIKITRRDAAQVDLYFAEAEPRFRSPDLWIDFIGDNGSDRPEDHRVYPPGMPVDLGEPFRIHPTRETAHWLIARLRNRGSLAAQGVRLGFSIAEPPGGGDDGDNYRAVGSITVPEIKGDDVPITVPVRWSVPGGFPGHVGIKATIEGYRVARELGGGASEHGPVAAWNGVAQKNVALIEALHAGTFAPIAFDYAVHNAASVPQLAYVEPEGLAEGLSLTVSPVSQIVPAGQSVIFRCRLTLDPALIEIGTRHDRRFRLLTWRSEPWAASRWGGVEYVVQPRRACAVSLTGYWNYGDEIVLTGEVAPNPGGGLVQIRLDFDGQPAQWVSALISGAGRFAWQGRPIGAARTVEAMAWFRSDGVLATARSGPLHLRAPGPFLRP